MLSPARPKLFPKPLPVAKIPAPVPTANRFKPLAEVAVENKNTIETKSYLKAEKMFSFASFVRASRPSKKRMQTEHYFQARQRRWLKQILTIPEKMQ